jgi:hypothetical protein
MAPTMRGHNPVGKLRTTWGRRERELHRGGATYYVGAISDDVGVVWTCEARKPRTRHEHPKPTFAVGCAEDALADGTWKADLPPPPAT